MRTTARAIGAAALLALVGAAGAYSAADPRQPDAAAARTAVPVVSYPIRVSFALDYDVRWKDGSEGDDVCSPWRLEQGRITVEARTDPSRVPFQGFLALNRPRRVALPYLTRDEPVWAQLTALGAVRGTVFRSLQREGGPTAGCNAPAYVPPRTDCGARRLEVGPPANPATVIAAFRPVVIFGANNDTLDYTENAVHTPPTDRQRQYADDPFNAYRQALFFAVQPARPLYQKCDATLAAPAYPFFVARDVALDDWRALARLRPGRAYTFGRTRTRQDCSDLEIAEFECTYALSIDLTIRRTA